MMGQRVVFFEVNGTKRRARHLACAWARRKLPQQFWAEFWTERLQTLKRHLESTQTTSSDPGPSSGGPEAEDGG